MLNHLYKNAELVMLALNASSLSSSLQLTSSDLATSSSKILNADVSVSSSATVITKPSQSTNENESNASSTDFLNSFKQIDANSESCLINLFGDKNLFQDLNAHLNEFNHKQNENSSWLAALKAALANPTRIRTFIWTRSIAGST
jgi:hypothetical protein